MPYSASDAKYGGHVRWNRPQQSRKAGRQRKNSTTTETSVELDRNGNIDPSFVVTHTMSLE